MKKGKNQPIIYICRDIERALGCLSIPSVSIISNESVFAKSVEEERPNRIFTIPNLNTYDTHELLEHTETKKILSTFDTPSLLVFKNTSIIEKWCVQHGHRLLNPSSKLAASIEEKITQLETLKDLVELMPRYDKKTIEEILWLKTPFILQFNRSHTGSGTIHISSEKILNELKEKYPKRDVRIAPFIEGPIFTSNIVVGKDAILRGNLSYQITGIQPFTDVTFATIGNDWGAPYRILNESERTAYDHLSLEVGNTLRRLGWKGLFGIDAIWSTREKRWYLIEINARQPASASYESELQLHIKETDDQITVLEAHVRALQDGPLTSSTLVRITDGAQIIHRVTHNVTSLNQVGNVIEKLESDGFRVIPYENTEHNSDLLRIQSPESIIEVDGEFTDAGKQITNIISA